MGRRLSAPHPSPQPLFRSRFVQGTNATAGFRQLVEEGRPEGLLAELATKKAAKCVWHTTQASGRGGGSGNASRPSASNGAEWLTVIHVLIGLPCLGRLCPGFVARSSGGGSTSSAQLGSKVLPTAAVCPLSHQQLWGGVPHAAGDLPHHLRPGVQLQGVPSPLAPPMDGSSRGYDVEVLEWVRCRTGCQDSQPKEVVGAEVRVASPNSNLGLFMGLFFKGVPSCGGGVLKVKIKNPPTDHL